ncbi:MAG: hypothetical protein KJ737_17565 [Proteobacteria bacterium]|nr:hypothetical protein [Pseudomonadota bacterium]
MGKSEKIYYGRMIPEELEITEGLYEINHHEFHTIKDRNGFDYYRVDIQHANLNKLQKIIQGCEAVEKACWSAQEKFYDYFKSKDLLIYVVKDEKIVAFQILSYWVIDRYILFNFDETMVIKEFRGKHLGFSLCTLSSRTLYIKFAPQKKIKYVLLSETPNPLAMRGMYKYRFLFFNMVNTFKPNAALLMIYKKLLALKEMTLVNEDYPFVFKKMFPGSLPPHNKEVKLPDTIQKMIPPEADFYNRGDAFVFMTIFSRLSCIPGIFMAMVKFFGKSFLSNSKVGLINKIKWEKEEIQNINMILMGKEPAS